MHELSLCQGLLAEVERVVARHGADGVGRIVVRIGPLAGVERHLLEEAFLIARAGTRAAGARLSVEPQPLRIRCLICGAQSDATPNHLVCAQCGEWRTQLVSGDEMLLASVELLFADSPTEEEEKDV